MSTLLAVEHFVDLLSESPEFRLNTRDLASALAFGFSSGGVQRPFESSLAQARLPHSRWVRDSFHDDLFVQRLVDLCSEGSQLQKDTSLGRGARTYLRALLCAPPDVLGDVVRRQAISAELGAHPQLCQAAEKMVREVAELFELLEVGGLGVRLDGTRRSLDVLSKLKRAVSLGAVFSEADSALSEVASFCRELQGWPVYERMSALLDYDRRQSTVEVELRIGRGGEVRSTHLLRVRENRENPYYPGPVRRLVQRLASLFRGYRVRSDEIFGRMLMDVFDELRGAVAALMQLVVQLELFLLGVRLKRRAELQGLNACLPELGNGQRDLEGLFNPFLLLEPRPPVTCDIRERGLTIVTGPNSGGKTRMLQAVSLCQLLAQAGLFAPARAARLPMHVGLFASLSAPVDAEQREGRLGTELLRIRRLFERIEVGSLVVVDELCSGTNPGEAEPLFRMVARLLGEVGADALVTTHFLDFAQRLQRDNDGSISFLQVELDAANHPTYCFLPGVATTALAEQTARRLGVTEEELMGLVQAARLRG